MSKRVTIKSIARDLNVSHMTVSRALSGNSLVKEETRKLVQRRAAELGYVKSAAAAAMRGDGPGIVGLLLPTLANEFYARFADSLAMQLEPAGLQLIIHLTADKPEQERRSLLKLREVQAAAVVMVPTPGSEQAELNQTDDMQVIRLIRTGTPDQNSYLALVDDRRAIVEAVRRLGEAGHRRIAYFGGATTLSSGNQRLSAFISGLREAGIALLPELLYTGAPTFAMGYNSATALVAEDAASALVCGGFEISTGALNGLLDQNIRLPEQIAFVGYGDPSYYLWLEGGISTIRIPVELLASKTARLIEPDSTGQQPHQRLRTVKAEFVERRTCGPSHRFLIR